MNEDHPTINHEQQITLPEHRVRSAISLEPDAMVALDEKSQDYASTSNLEQRVPQPPMIPLTEDVLSIFGLEPLVATVARIDPRTGEKINKLRKSYENHLKAFGLAGRNKNHKAEANARLMTIAQWPNEEYQNQRITGKDLMQGLSRETLEKLDRAMHMKPGPVPENGQWEELLGHEKTKPTGLVAEKKGKVVGTTAQLNGATIGNRAYAIETTESEESRPVRAGKRRRYNDHSFEGYAEGFEDDDMDITGGDAYSSEEHSRRGSFKRRKKYSKDFAISN